MDGWNNKPGMASNYFSFCFQINYTKIAWKNESNLHIIQHISNSGIIKLKNVILKVPSYYQHWYSHPQWWTTHIKKKKKVSPQTVWFPQSTVGYTTKQVQHSQAVIVLACLTKPKTQSQIIGINSLVTQVFSFRINMRSQTGVYFSHNKSIWALPTSIREIIRETDGKHFLKLTLKRKWSTV